MEGVATRRATLAASRATAPLPKFRGPEQLPPRLPGFSGAAAAPAPAPADDDDALLPGEASVLDGGVDDDDDDDDALLPGDAPEPRGEPLIGLPLDVVLRALLANNASAALALRAASSAWRYRVNFLSPRLRPALGGDLERSLESLRRATETLPTAKALRFSERRPGSWTSGALGALRLLLRPWARRRGPEDWRGLLAAARGCAASTRACLNVLLAIDVDDARAVAARADDFDAAHALLADELEADRGIAAARRGVRE